MEGGEEGAVGGEGGEEGWSRGGITSEEIDFFFFHSTETLKNNEKKVQINSPLPVAT